jgi:putative hemolysin
MKTKKQFTRFDVRQFVDIPRWLQIVGAPVIYLVNRWLLVSSYANNVIKKNEHLSDIQFMAGSSDTLGLEVTVRGSLPQQGAVITVANHPGGADLLAVFKALSLAGREDVKVLINPLVHFQQIAGMVVPIPKGDPAKKSEMQMIVNQAFEKGNLFHYFPAGKDSRKIGGRIQDLTWKGTFVSHAIKHGVSIVPMHISGQNSKFFYWLAGWTKRLGLPNFEQAFLIREVWKARGSKIVITFGKPIDPKQFGISPDDRRGTTVIAQKIRSHVYELARDPDAEFTH